MLAPAAPHITEELWSRRLAAAGEPWSSIHVADLARGRSVGGVEATREVPVQVNGKLRDKVVVRGRRLRGRHRGGRSWPARRSRRSSTGARRTEIIEAGGGKLVNIVVR